MRKIITLILAIFLMLPVSAQVGRYKNIKLLYPGYSLKLDTATGELSAVHFDDESEKTVEETLLKKQSHNARQVGRYELRRTKCLGTYEVFDTSSGEYTTVKWTPKGKNGEPIDANIDSALNTVSEGLKRMLKSLEEGIDKMRTRDDSVTDSIWTISQTHPDGFTVNVRTMTVPMEGICVAYSATQDSHGRDALEEVISHATQHDGFVGGWLDPSDSLYYFDSVRIFPEDSLEAAINFGKANHQDAVYKLSTRQEIRLIEDVEFVSPAHLIVIPTR